jgi:hypothetical protein
MERLGIHHVTRSTTPSDPLPDPEPPLHPAEEARRRSAADGQAHGIRRHPEGEADRSDQQQQDDQQRPAKRPHKAAAKGSHESPPKATG